jgi:hypothetical protein
VIKVPFSINKLGESTIEDNINSHRKDSARLPVKSHGAKKDGIVTCQLATAAIKAGRASLVGMFPECRFNTSTLSKVWIS